MKTQILALALIFTLTLNVFAQEKPILKKDFIFYSLFVNKVPDECNLPLIGMINIADGDHKSIDFGFINLVKNNFWGGQIGFLNATGGSCNGTQIGFANLAEKKSDNIQIGFINLCGDSLKGAQIGFWNSSINKTDAVQIGFINTAKSLKGFQMGFINLVDSIESGVPLGFLSLVKKGGYQAIEFSISEMYPVNISYKIGVKQLYTSFALSYNPTNEKEVAFGAGLGSLFPIGKKLYFNPEYMTQTMYLKNSKQLTSITANFGYQLDPHITLLAGPSVVWQNKHDSDQGHEPLFSFFKKTFDKGNLTTGARFSIRYSF